MKAKHYFLFLFLAFIFKLNAQDNIDIVFSEVEINKALTVIKESRAINFGEYYNKNGINAWYINLDNAFFDIKTNSRITISNISISGGVDLSLWVYRKTATGNIKATIEGEFIVKGDYTKGYTLNIVPTEIYSNYDGPLESVGNVLINLSNNFEDYIPPIEISMGKSILPEMLLQYFKSGMPVITSTNDEIRLRFEVLFDDLKIKNKIIKSAETVALKAHNSITFDENLLIEQGAIFSATIE